MKDYEKPIWDLRWEFTVNYCRVYKKYNWYGESKDPRYSIFWGTMGGYKKVDDCINHVSWFIKTHNIRMYKIIVKEQKDYVAEWVRSDN